MAFVVKRKHGFELRTTRMTDAGPRATTLATFRVLDDEVLRRARERSTDVIDALDVRRRARLVGAPVAPPDVVLASRSLLVQLDRGHRPPPALAQRLTQVLATSPPSAPPGVGDALDDALPWIDTSDAERGAALVDLLALTDRLPAPRATPLRFPHLDSRGS
jgi:hypothetical protein